MGFAFGGWGGCETCSEVFSQGENRKEFATSVLELLYEYDLDGIDLDWEYPAMQGFPGHAFKPEDQQNFTALVRHVAGNPDRRVGAIRRRKSFLKEYRACREQLKRGNRAIVWPAGTFTMHVRHGMERQESPQRRIYRGPPD